MNSICSWSETFRKQVNKEIKKFVNLAIDKAVKNKSDIFGFGLKFNQIIKEQFKK